MPFVEAPSWRTTHFRLSKIAYSVLSQLLTTPTVRPVKPQAEDASRLYVRVPHNLVIAKRKFIIKSTWKSENSLILSGQNPLPLTMREESRLRVFKNIMLRHILGPKRDDVTGE